MASASSSAQAAFGLGRRKKNPGLLDQIGKFFGGDKKRKSKVRREGREPSSQSAVCFVFFLPDVLQNICGVFGMSNVFHNQVEKMIP